MQIPDIGERDKGAKMNASQQKSGHCCRSTCFFQYRCLFSKRFRSFSLVVILFLLILAYFVGYRVKMYHKRSSLIKSTSRSKVRPANNIIDEIHQKLNVPTSAHPRIKKWYTLHRKCKPVKPDQQKKLDERRSIRQSTHGNDAQNKNSPSQATAATISCADLLPRPSEDIREAFDFKRVNQDLSVYSAHYDPRIPDHPLIVIIGLTANYHQKCVVSEYGLCHDWYPKMNESVAVEAYLSILPENHYLR